jgi:nitrite reductase/ring-hydroxylating ferredoxin subunit
MGQFVPVARVNDIPDGTGREVTVQGRVLAIYQVRGQFYALDGICPHAGGPLGEGDLDGCVVTCPWHGWQFDVTTGEHCLNRRLRQRTFPVRIVEGQVEVDLSESSPG